MKKIFRLFAAFAAATMAFSCMEEANPESGTQNGGSNYDGPMVTLTFSVDQLTKTSYDKENGHQWSEGDQIKIIWGAEDNAYTVADVVNGKVSAQVGVADAYYAVYPETTAYTFTAPEGSEEAQLTVAIPQTQDGSFKQANLMAAKTAANERCFAFRNLTHIIKFTLSEDSAYKGFQFMSNSNSNTLISGAISVRFDSLAISTPIDEQKIGETTYKASSVVQVANLTAGGTYYIGVCPGVDMQYGFGFKATKTEGTTNWSEGALLMGTVDTDRLKITSITNLDKAIRPNFFFKETACGTGDGSSWDNAGDVNLLVKLLGDEIADGVKYNKTTNGWRLYGAKLYLAAGTYTLPEMITIHIGVNNKTMLYGGYPTNLTGTSLQGRDVAANETIITKDGDRRLFYCNGSIMYNWTLDGITFTLNETTIDRGGAFYWNNSSKGTVRYNNCTFKNMSTTSGNGGGAICLDTQKSEIKVTFDNCKFTNNETTKIGGAVYIQDGRKATVTFNSCLFSGNKAVTAGGAIANSMGTIIVNGCSFTDNYSTNHGGAICTYGESISNNSTLSGPANAYIYNTLFDNNDVKADANQGGSIKVHGNGNIVVVNSTFRNSDASTGILRLRSQVVGSTKGWVIGCTFSENNKISIYNQDSDMWVYNTILNDTNSYYANNAGGKGTFGDIVFLKDNYYYSPGGELTGTAKTYLSSLTDKTQLDASVVGAYDETKGVYSVTGVALTNGMSAAELSALATDITAAMPLFDATKLTVDQKGNSREGKTVIGAYVGE